jgi:hypothetical protein
VARVVGSSIGGKLLIEGNHRETHVIDNTVRGDLQLFGNTGAVAVSDNRIDGRLQCRENRPAPSGRNNVARTGKEEQCARL